MMAICGKENSEKVHYEVLHVAFGMPEGCLSSPQWNMMCHNNMTDCYRRFGSLSAEVRFTQQVRGIMDPRWSSKAGEKPFIFPPRSLTRRSGSKVDPWSLLELWSPEWRLCKST